MLIGYYMYSYQKFIPICLWCEPNLHSLALIVSKVRTGRNIWEILSLTNPITI